MRRNDMESGSPRGFPFHPGVIKASQDIPSAFSDRSTGKFARSDADKCTSSVLSSARQSRYVSTAGINSRQKSKGEREREREREREERCTADLYDITIARKTPAFSLPSKTSSVQAVRLENLHPRDVSARLLTPVSSLKLDIRTTNSMTNAKILKSS